MADMSSTNRTPPLTCRPGGAGTTVVEPGAASQRPLEDVAPSVARQRAMNDETTCVCALPRTQVA